MIQGEWVTWRILVPKSAAPVGFKPKTQALYFRYVICDIVQPSLSLFDITKVKPNPNIHPESLSMFLFSLISTYFYEDVAVKGGHRQTCLLFFQAIL